MLLFCDSQAENREELSRDLKFSVHQKLEMQSCQKRAMGKVSEERILFLLSCSFVNAPRWRGGSLHHRVFRMCMEPGVVQGFGLSII